MGGKSLIINTLCYGGDRWFVYTLFIIFLLLIPVRDWLKNKWVDFTLIVVLIVVYFLDFLPTIFALDKVFYFMVFFISGFMLCEHYEKMKKWCLSYWWLLYSMALVLNVFFILQLSKNTFVFRFVLPYTGTFAVLTMAFQLEKLLENSRVVQYIEYCGKYSLQFYLFPAGSIYISCHCGLDVAFD